MKKRTPVFLAIILIVFPAEAYGLDFNGWLGVFSFSFAADFSSHSDDDSTGLFGIGFSAPLFFNEKKIGKDKEAWFPESIFFKIEPVALAEYSFSVFDSNLFRIRTGAHIGGFYSCVLVSMGCYAGLSGAFLKDFTNGAAIVGISPEIGFEFYMLFIGGRFQAQYDFYTVERYNRLVLTISLCIMIPGLT